jgi:hypothetical protein
MFVDIPAAWESSPIASTAALTLEQLQGIGPPVLDLQAQIQAYEASAYVQPIYNTWDLHPKANGRQFIADHISTLLTQLAPWSRPEKTP